MKARHRKVKSLAQGQQPDREEQAGLAPKQCDLRICVPSHTAVLPSVTAQHSHAWSCVF